MKDLQHTVCNYFDSPSDPAIVNDEKLQKAKAKKKREKKIKKFSAVTNTVTKSTKQRGTAKRALGFLSENRGIATTRRKRSGKVFPFIDLRLTAVAFEYQNELETRTSPYRSPKYPS